MITSADLIISSTSVAIPENFEFVVDFSGDCLFDFVLRLIILFVPNPMLLSVGYLLLTLFHAL